MKKTFLCLVGILIGISQLSIAQTIVFEEDFESAPYNLAPSGTPTFSINTRLHAAGTSSDSCQVALMSTAYLTSNAFSTAGNSSVILQFDQICKVELFDAAEIQYSIDGGTSWTNIALAQYLGSGSFAGNKFTANSYPADWQATTPSASPTNTWWKTEQFDLSSLMANQANCKIRFVLRDGNNNGPNQNRGWFLDNIKVTIAASELTPPTITYIAPIIQDTVYTTGPFNITATITDASGIDTAILIYSRNYGVNDTVGMVNTTGSTYVGVIPAQAYLSHIDYQVQATDASAAGNSGSGAAKWFYIKKPGASVVIGTGTSTQSLLPFYGFYNYGWGAMLYTAAEIGQAGVIDSVFFYVGNSVTSYAMINQRLLVSTVPYTSFADGSKPDSASMTLVYDGNPTWVGPGWFKIAFSSPYVYDGTGSLLLQWINRDGTYVSGYPTFQYTTTSTNQGKYTYSDTYSSVFPSVSGSLTTQRPNLRITFQANNSEHDAGVFAITEPTGTVVSGTPLDVKVQIKNFGSDTLTGATIRWSVNGVNQSDFAWTGSLLQDQVSATATIGTFNFPLGTSSIKAWVVNPDGFPDETAYNDTSVVNVYGCSSILSGAYTIDGSLPTAGTNYNSFNDAFNALYNCGINGPTVFNIASGTYNTQLSINDIIGASVANTVTFQAQSGNPADVVITYAASSSANNYVLKFDGTDFVTFKNVTMTATGTSYAHVVEFADTTTNVNLINCHLNGPSVASTSSDYAVIYNGSTTKDTSITIQNNVIANGSYGMYFYGIGSTSLENSNKVLNNIIQNFYYIGMYVYYQNNFEVSGNTLSTNSSYTSTYGIQLSYCDNALKVTKNKISIPNYYGLYLYYSDGTVSNPGLVANNFISVGGVGTDYGINTYYSTYQRIYNNSVNMYSTGTSSRAMYLNSGTSSIDIKNNNFVNRGTGYAIYSLVTGLNCNYNNLYSAGTNLGYYSSTNQVDLSAWQTATAQDANSICENPAFTSNTDLHTTTTQLNAAATPLAVVTDDIDGQARNATTPDIGADEFVPAPIDLAMNSVVGPINGGCYGPNQTVTVRIFGAGMDTVFSALNNVNVYCQTTGPNPVLFPVVTLSSDTIPNGEFLDVVISTTYDMSIAGTYNFKAWVNTAADPNQINDTLTGVTRVVPITYSMPVACDFTAFTGSNLGTVFTGWNEAQGTPPPAIGGSNWISKTGLGSPTNVNAKVNLYYTSQNAWINTPFFTVDPGTLLKFDASVTDYGSTTAGETMGVDDRMQIMITKNCGLTWYPIEQVDASDALPVNLTGYIIGLDSLAGQVIGIGFYATDGPIDDAQDYDFNLDNINILVPPNQEAELSNLILPMDFCGLGLEPVTIDITNKGAQVINGNLTAHYQLDGSAIVVSEAVPNLIGVLATSSFTFTTLADFSVLTTDSVFGITAWIDLIGDPIQSNDTLTGNVTSIHSPLPAVSNNITIPYATSGVLTATAIDTIQWYADPALTNLLSTGVSYTTPVLYDTTLYYVAATNGVQYNYTFDTDLQGWSALTPCSSYTSYNWAWASDAGEGTAYMIDPDDNSSAVLQSPVLNVFGDSIDLNFTHRFGTESCCDRGYVAYRVDGGAWTIFTPTTGGYSGVDGLSVDPFFGACSYTTGTISTYGGTAAYFTSGGKIPLNGGTQLEIAFVFSSDGSVAGTGWFIDEVHLEKSGCPSSYIIDTVFVTGIPTEDVGVIAIDAPNSGIELTAMEPVSIRVYNYGSNTISNIPVNYKLNGGAAVSEILAGPIAPGDTVVYNFTQTANLSSIMTHNMVAYTTAAADLFTVNDTAYKFVVNNMLSYCASGATSTGDEDIGNVTFGTINNTSPAPHNGTYTDFSMSVPAANVAPGQTYPISVTIVDDAASYYSGYCEVYIDYNHDGTFTEPAEVAFGSAYTAQATSTLSGNVTIPASAVNGTTMMRVVAQESATAPSVYPCGTFSWGETEDYLLQIAPNIPNDAGVISINEPGYIQSEGVQAPFEICVTNFGTDTLNDIPIEYVINSGSIQTYTWIGQLLPGDTICMNLGLVDVLVGSNSICAYTVVVDDSNTFNDMDCINYYGLPPTVLFEDDMENGTEFSTTDPLWEHGVPTATIINSAYSPDSVWATNLDGNYTNSAMAYLNFPAMNFSGVTDAYMTLYYWMDGESSADGGYIQYSTNNGVSWFTLGYLNDPDGYNWYDSYIGGPSGWSESTNGWRPAFVKMTQVNNINNVLMRFVFKSNSSVVHNGFAIDDVKILAPQAAIDAGIVNIVAPVGQTTPAQPVTVTVTIENFGTTELTSIPLSYEINTGYPPQNGTWTGSLLPGATVDYTFTSTYIGPAQDYTLCAYTKLTTDPYHMNDTTCAFINMGAAAHDVGVCQIVSPSSSTVTGAVTNVSVWIKNYGTSSETDIPVQFLINSLAQATETWIGTLAPGDSVLYNFTATYQGPISQYNFCAKTVLVGDQVSSNDATCFTVTVGIDDMGNNGFALMQNIPNPASANTEIPFYLPTGGKCRLIISNIIGEIVFTDEVEGMSGINTYRLDLGKLDQGVYSYTLHFGEFSQTRRLTVIK